MCMKRDLCIRKEAYVYEKRPGMCHKRPTYMRRNMYMKRDICIYKETYQVRICSGRRVVQIQKGRARRVAKETYLHEKRPMYMKGDL